MSLASEYNKDMNPRFFDIRVNLIKNLIKKYKPRKVLDIGCGTGIFLDYFHKEFEWGVGVDSSGDMIQYAKKNHSRRNIKYMLGNDASMPFEDNSFDLVLSMGTFEYVKGQKKHIDEALRVLKKNGILFLATPTKIMNIYKIARFLGLAAARYWKINKYLSFEELEDLIDKNSSRILKHKVLFFNPSKIKLFDLFFDAVNIAAGSRLNKYLLGPQYVIARKL